MKKNKLNIINIYGASGSGKTTIISDLDLDKKDIVLVDFKEDTNLKEYFKDSYNVYCDYINPLNTLDYLKLTIQKRTPKIIIIDEAQKIKGKEYIFKKFIEDILPIVKDTNAILILSSQDKFVLKEDIKYFEIKINNFKEAENKIKEIDNYLKENLKYNKNVCFIKKMFECFNQNYLGSLGNLKKTNMKEKV